MRVRLAGEQLSIVGHPMPVRPWQLKASWSLTDINEAFNQTLKPALQPIAMPKREYRWESPSTLLSGG